MVLPLGDLQPTRIVPIVTYILIALNVTVFLIQQERGEEFTRAFAMTPWEISHNEDLIQPRDRPVRILRPRRLRRRPLGSSQRSTGTFRLADPRSLDSAHFDVPPRELASPAGEHAVSLDRRRQCRGSPGPVPLSHRVSGVRADGLTRPDRGQFPIGDP